MRNAEVARVFDRIAALLQIEGEPVFKTRAYARAADVIANHPVELESVATELDALKQIPGVGNAIALKIQELYETGRLAFYDDLESRFPAGLMTLLEIPGVGPRTALRASKELGIDSVEALEASIESGEFEALPRVGEKNAASILRHIRSQRRQSDRHMLGAALPQAESLLRELAAVCPDIRNATVAGSARRGAETVGDIDLLCTADDPGRVTAALAGLAAVEDVPSQEPTRASVVLKSGLQVDLQATNDDSYGALLLYFTGSKPHGIALRQRAQSMGLSLNEYGMTPFEGGAIEEFPDEESVYRRLGLQYIPPELREDRGEIERAASGSIPSLIEQYQIRGDLHVHSDWSDGRVPVEEMLAEASAIGREYVAITDHSSGRGVANGLSDARLLAHNKEIDRLNDEWPAIEVLKGSEVDIRADGSLDYSDELLSSLDVVIASVHSAMAQEPSIMTARLITAMENPHVTAIGHLTTRLLFDGVRSRDPIEIDFDTVFSSAAATGTFMEINSSPRRLDLKDTHIFRARELGVRFLVDTDAHRPKGLSDMRYGVTMARRGWCEPSHIANTLPVERFLRMLKSPKRDRYGLVQSG